MNEMMKKDNQNIPTMETTKVIIENWPNDPWMKTWLPVIISSFIALIALGVSLISVHYTKKEFNRNSRPYVWAINASDLGNRIERPDWIVFRTSNSPAKIKMRRIEIYVIDSNTKKKLFNQEEGPFIRYPDASADWHYEMPIIQWTDILKDYSSDQTLQRHITIEYSSIDGNQNYSFKMIQKFVPNVNLNWQDSVVHAN